MKSFSEDTHSFIVRIWHEPRELAGAEPQLRGAIEHIQSGERRAFKDLEEIIFFITPYLGKTATRALRGHKFRRLLSDWKFPRKKRG